MKRQSLENGKWFDIDSATVYKEESYWNGSNHISKATGSQWESEQLYHTKTGKWVLNCWSRREGTRETWDIVDDQTAYNWLINNSEFDVAQKLFPEKDTEV